MDVVIASELLAEIVAAAEASPGAEVCGLLLGPPAPLCSREGGSPDGAPAFAGAQRVTVARPCANVAADPSHRFEIDPATLLEMHRSARNGGPAIVGHYHSHPSGDPTPSPRDAADAAPDGSLWLVAARGEVCAFRAVANGALYGRFDPVALRVTD